MRHGPVRAGPGDIKKGKTVIGLAFFCVQYETNEE
jgi:hypothetical protein